MYTQVELIDRFVRNGRHAHEIGTSVEVEGLLLLSPVPSGWRIRVTANRNTTQWWVLARLNGKFLTEGDFDAITRTMEEIDASATHGN